MSIMILSFLAFAVATSTTPGPNNLLVLATAAQHGGKAAIPLVFGSALGFGFMVGVVIAGLAGLLTHHPDVHSGMRWVGTAWILILAWRISRVAPAILSGPKAIVSIGFWGSCAFQWINPKAWVMALATSATYTVPGDDLWIQVFLLSSIFAVISFPCVGIWALLGTGVSTYLTTTKQMRIFNQITGLLLAASVLPILIRW